MQLRLTGGFGRPERRRAGLLAAILVAHGALIAVVIANRAGEPQPPRQPARLMTFDVTPATPASPSPVSPPPPVVSPIRLPAPVPQPVPAAGSDLVADGMPSGASGCDLTGVVQAALRENPTARAAVASLPVDVRSVANAVMLWDGEWTAPAGNAQSMGARGIIRNVVLGVVASASAECRAAPQAGPRLIMIPGSPDTTLALGSGHWRWQDVEPKDAAPPATRSSPHVVLASNIAPARAETRIYSPDPSSAKSGGRSGT